MRNNMHSAFEKMTGRRSWKDDVRTNSTSSKRNTEKANHQYSDSIGGDSSNYKLSKDGE